MTNHGFAFILTPIELLCPAGAEVAPGHRLVRANADQIDRIKEILAKFNTNPLVLVSPYENRFQKVPGANPGNYSFATKALAREDWKYWIIDFNGTNSELQEVGWACSLIPNDIELGFFFLFNDDHIGFGHGWDPAALSSFFNHLVFGSEPKPIAQNDLAQIRQNYDNIKKIPENFPHIRRSLQRFGQLNWLPRRSEMLIIGLISVIESLVSHAPKLTDSTDSLSHQLRTKLPLLRKRFAHPLEHASLFGNIDEENLWKKLYAYRSKIVHGEDSQLSGDLSCLVDLDSVIFFLRETSKRLIELSLREPQFVTDLKKC